MKVKVQKWGNSNGIRIPSVLLKNLNIKENDILLLEEDDDRIIITKSNNKISLKELFDNYNGENLASEFSWDEPRGREIW